MRHPPVSIMARKEHASAFMCVTGTGVISRSSPGWNAQYPPMPVEEQVVVIYAGAFDGWYRGRLCTHVAGALKLAPNTLTFHFDRLRDSGLVTVRRERRRTDAVCQIVRRAFGHGLPAGCGAAQHLGAGYAESSGSVAVREKRAGPINSE